MAKYIKEFVTGHGITYDRNKRNAVAFEKASVLWAEIWSSLRDQLDGDSIVMLCGAKNNGKSSLMRYLINNYNRKKGRGADEIEMIDDNELIEDGSEEDRDRYAYLIDYDPGQAELTSAGIISAHIIRATAQELQSPTYLNMAQHEPLIMSSVGGSNMSVNPKMYIDNGRVIYTKVIEHRDQQKVKRPIFINTMGFIRNVGLAMLMDLIKICRPTDLFVLNVESDPLRTIYADLSSKAVDNTRASFYYETSRVSQSKLNYKLHLHSLQFMFFDSSSVANKNRTALQLAYMATIPQALYQPIMRLNTKWLSLKKVSVYCVSSYPLKEGIVLELLHHSWIHLVKLKKSSLQWRQQQQELTTSSTITTAALPIETSLDNHQTTIGSGASSLQEETICRLVDDVNENILYGCGIVAEIDLAKKLIAVITPVDQSTLDNHVDCIIKPLSIQVPREMFQENN